MTAQLVYSPSMLKTYMTCPHKFQAQSILKTIKWEQSDAAKRGEQLHALMETAINNNLKWEDVKWTDEKSAVHAKKFLDIVAYLRKNGWQCQTEVGLGTDGYGNALDFWDMPPQNFMRCRIDFLATNPKADFAIVFDWKTGKKYECDKLQLQVNAVCLQPVAKTNKFQMGFAYLDSGDFVKQNIDITNVDVRNYDANVLAQSQCVEMLVALRDIQKAVAMDIFPMTKNRFCRWCQCTDCPYAGK